MVFPVVMWMWESDHKEGWGPKNWCFQTVVLEKTLESPWDSRRSNQSILKEINPEYSLEGLMLKLKLQYFSQLSQLTGKDPDAGKDWRREEKGTTEDEMVGWCHQVDGHEFEQALGVWWWTGKPGIVQSMGLQSQTWLSDWTEIWQNNYGFYGC